jgi:hypothetical protein
MALFYRRMILLCIFCGVYFYSFAQNDSAVKKIEKAQLQDSSSKNNIVTIADIAVNGNKKTKSYLILRELSFQQQDSFPENELEKKLLLAHDQLINTSLFVDVQVSVASRQGNLLFINVDVKERWYLFPLPYFKLVDRNLNDWIVQDKASFDRVNYGIKFMQNNVSGRNDNLNIWLINGYNTEIDLKYVQPFADKSLKNGYQLNFVYATQHELNYNTDLSKQLIYTAPGPAFHNLNFSASYLYTPAIKTRHSFTLGYAQDKISDSVFQLNPDFFSGNAKNIRYPFFSYTLVYTNVDNVAYPTRGFRGDFTFTKKGVDQLMNVWQFITHATYTIPLAPKMQLQFTEGSSLTLPFHQPFYNKQLFGYGDAYLQGLEYYVIDGVAGAVVRAALRREIFTLNLNTHLKSKIYNKIPFHFYLKTYGNLGYAYNPDPGNSLLNNRLLETEGFGLDIVTIYDLVFKIEYSFNQLGQQGIFIHTGTDF